MYALAPALQRRCLFLGVPFNTNHGANISSCTAWRIPVLYVSILFPSLISRCLSRGINSTTQRGSKNLCFPFPLCGTAVSGFRRARARRRRRRAHNSEGCLRVSSERVDRAATAWSYVPAKKGKKTVELRPPAYSRRCASWARPTANYAATVV